MNIKIHASSSQIAQKKKKKIKGIDNSNDKKLYVNKSGAMMIIKKIENQKFNENLLTTTFSNQNIFNKYKNSSNICSSFRQNNGIGGTKGSRLQNTISFGNNILSKTNMTGLYNVNKLANNNDNINIFYNKNNVLTSTNLCLL